EEAAAMLTRRAPAAAGPVRHARGFVATAAATLSRRLFLQRSGLGVAGLSAAAAGAFTRIGKAAPAREGPVEKPGEIQRKKTVCPFCSVGCSIWAEVQDGV